MSNFTRRTIAAALAAAAMAASLKAGAAEPLKIRFTLDWKLQGVHAPFYLAAAKGYFAKENLDVKIDQGEGSAATISRIMSGAYDAGFGDINAVIQAAALHPKEAPVTVAMIYDSAPFAIVTKASSPIKSLQDLPGHILGSPAGGAVLKLLPAVAKKAGFDPSKVKILNMVPSLQEQMLVQGQDDASAVFNVTSYFNLESMKLDPDKDFRWLTYKDAGLDLYSNGIVVSQKLVHDHPEAVKGLVRAILHAWQDAARDPQSAIDVISKQEPLLNAPLEKQRLIYTYRNLIDTKEARAIGLGAVDDARLRENINVISSIYSLPTKPAAGKVFDSSFLPPLAQRRAPAIAR